jgi:hypothetical protein
MLPDTVREEALLYLGYEARTGLDRRESWRRWTVSKQFNESDESAIATEVRKIRIERSTVSFLERQAAAARGERVLTQLERRVAGLTRGR